MANNAPKRSDLPSTAFDFLGNEHEIEYPDERKWSLVVHEGMVSLWKRKKLKGPKKYAVVYGFQMEYEMDYDEAAEELGYALLHQAAMNGITDDE